MMETVDILLATFNGARFLPEQLASIEAQTNRDWRLLVRDDGSSDHSPAIVEAFAERHGDRVRVLRDGRGRLGLRANFAALLEASDAPYFMLCDQDDVWLPDKVAGLLGALRVVEDRRGAATPVLVHSDLVVVDDELHVLHPSFWRYARLHDPTVQRPATRLIVRNYVTGCALIGNAALRRAALPIPSEAYMHDWWLGLVAAFLGEIADHPVATVLYRQHHGNEIGAQPRRLWRIIWQFLRSPGSTIQEVRLYIAGSQRQAAVFAKAHYGTLSPSAHPILSEFSRPQSGGLWRRKTFLLRYHLWPDYWLSSAILWSFL